jgi:hypothetical protein
MFRDTDKISEFGISDGEVEEQKIRMVDGSLSFWLTSGYVK